jgi:transcriptional regulator with XRE-family HTH domain
MYRYLVEGEHLAIKKLRLEEGMKIKEIAKRFNVCEATVSNIVKGNTVPRGTAKLRKASKQGPAIEAHELESQDFSQLPDDVMFEHVKEYNFIG